MFFSFVNMVYWKVKVVSTNFGKELMKVLNKVLAIFVLFFDYTY